MASSDVTESDDGSDLYDCQVCLHFMMDKIPRTLHCLHTFCEDCLQKLLNNKTIQCPTCRSVTRLAQNDVKVLPVNFILNKMKGMKDKMENMNDKMEDMTGEIKDMKEVINEMESVTKTIEGSNEKDITKCDLCDAYKALYKCKECSHIMCSLCKSKHDKVPLFKSHLIQKKEDLSSDFCEPHRAKVTHACLKCGRTLCRKCVIFNHVEHSEDINCADCAIKKFKDEMNERREQISDKLEWLTKKETLLKGKTSVVLFRKAMLLEKMESLRKQCEDLTTESENYQQMLNDFNETHKVCLEMINDLKGKCMETDIEIFREYTEFRAKAEQTLDLIETKISSDNDTALSVTCSKQGPKGEIQNLSVRRLLVTVKASPTFKCQGQMALIGKHAMSVSALNPPHVIRMDEQGKVVSKYMAEEQGGQVIGVNVFESQIYIVQMKGISVLKPEDDCNDKHVFYHLQLDEGSKICVFDNSNILFSDPSKGTVNWYNTHLDSTETLLEELKYPTYITTALVNSRRMFLVCERDANLVNNLGFELEHCIGDNDGNKLNLPQSTVFTEMDTVLVCDENNSSISHFKLDGTFLKHVVDDGERTFPRGLAYMYPYLWTSRYDGNWLKCYELRKNSL